MQGNVAQALALVTVGNAALAGADVVGFWPDATVFRFSKICEFLEPAGGDEWRQVAADPLQWFETLKPWCKDLRFHVASRPLENTQMPLPEHITVAFVGGGPRWLIETVGAERSKVWQGFDRLLDRKDPQQKIWANGYLLQGETEAQAFTAAPLAETSAALELVLVEIEQLAKDMDAGNFVHCFANARAALKGERAPAYYEDIVRYSGLSGAAQSLLAAVSHAWVFGGMGSWNDIGSSGDEIGKRYDRLSAELFSALEDSVAAVANSTYRG
jgi:hypothetical protein